MKKEYKRILIGSSRNKKANCRSILLTISTIRSYPSFAERPNGHFQSLTLSSPQEFRHVRAPQKDNCYLKFWPQGALRSPVLKLLMSFESFWPEIFDKMWVFNQTTDYYSWQFQVVHVYIPFKKEGRWTNMDILSTYYVLLKSFE